MKTDSKLWLVKALIFVFFVGGFAACSKKGGSPAPPTPPPVVTPPVAPVNSDVAFWLTNADKSALLQKQNLALNFSIALAVEPVITVDTTQTFQTIDGFGYALTDGSASLIHQLPSSQRADLLNELILTDSNHIGVSYLRVTIGASDMSARVFSYDDNASPSQPDTTLANFDLSDDKIDLVPLLQQIVALNPSIKILACPWSAPLWMKSNNGSVGGSLLTRYYDVYAHYFVKYIQAMKAAGITIDAITPQNEPLNPNNNPSMSMQATEEEEFVKNHLGPAFQAAGISTKIIVWDHNCDVPSYPETILADADAAKYVDGSGWHLYGGDISALSTVHNLYPNKNIYFTEQYVAGPGNFAGDLEWAMKNLIIGAPRNWSRNVIEWNMAADPNYGPHTSGGCGNCQGAFTIGGSSVTRNTSYYIIAHASKFVRPGSVRVSSNIPGSLLNVAYRTPDGKKVLIVLNDTGSPQTFTVVFNGKNFSTTLNGGAVGTYVW
jgi:glucosylceramidase